MHFLLIVLDKGLKDIFLVILSENLFSKNFSQLLIEGFNVQITIAVLNFVEASVPVRACTDNGDSNRSKKQFPSPAIGMHFRTYSICVQCVQCEPVAAHVSFIV